jgi:hypothetical protein
MFYLFADVLAESIILRFSTEHIFGSYQLFINFSMKLLIAFSPLIFLILLQEQICYFYMIKHDSSGYYQDADFVIGGLFSLRLAFGQDFKAKFGSEDKLDTLDIVSL